MDKSRIEISPKVWLDYRRAIFLEEHGVLAVADLHLGYALAHRYHGQMLPFGGGDQLLERLSELCAFYQPRQFAFLGDLVHQPLPLAELVEEFRRVFSALSSRCKTRLIIGNHDRKLKRLLADEPLELLDSVRVGKFLLLHGNEKPEAGESALILMGHEHPAISLGDGVKSAKFPCFLVSESVLVLPAFSHWAAGSNVAAHPFMSELAQGARFKKAVAICGNKLLPVSLN